MVSVNIVNLVHNPMQQKIAKDRSTPKTQITSNTNNKIVVKINTSAIINIHAKGFNLNETAFGVAARF